MKRNSILFILMALIMTGCFNQPINKTEDVIISHGMIVKNREKLDAFIHNNKGSQRVVHYTTEGEQAKIELLKIPFDVDQQDRFDFVLKYGVNQKNEINTIDMKLVKDLQNGEVIEVSEFQLSAQERGQIYKEMMLANYLDEKKLSTECNRKPAVSYDLTVQINGGEHHYQWTECANTEDDGQMIELVQAIIKIVQAGNIYQQLPEVKGHYE